MVLKSAPTRSAVFACYLAGSVAALIVFPSAVMGQLFQLMPQRLNGGAVEAKQNTETDEKADEKDAEAKKTRRFRDSIDERLPWNHRHAEFWERLHKSDDDEEKWEGLQKLLDDEQDSLLMNEDGRWESIRAQVDRWIGQMTPTAREAYRQRFDSFSRQLWQEAQRTGRPEQVAEIARRFFGTPAGEQAANWLASWHFDRGEFISAARWFERLWRVKADVADSVGWRLQAGVAFAIVGWNDLVDEVLCGHDMALPTLPETAPFHSSPRIWAKTIASRLRRAKPHLQRDWPLWGGNSQRGAVAQTIEPMLMPLWSQSLSTNYGLERLTDSMMEELHGRQLVTIPSAIPLIVGDLAVISTLNGVKVVDLKTGELRWQTLPPYSLEKLLTGTVNGLQNGSTDNRQLAVNSRITRQGMTAGESHPLMNDLLRNSAGHLLSSDGRLLFVLERTALATNQPPGSQYRTSLSVNDVYRRDWSSNWLTAYEISSGQILWQQGGSLLGPPFDSALQGVFFLGAPLPIGTELFVMGEKEGDISLHCLDLNTGKLRWSQWLATADAPIDRDLVRRWWSTQITECAGLLICPTGVGWLMAVDRTERSIVWSVRYTVPATDNWNEINRSRGNNNLTPFRSLNDRWASSVPLVADGRVLLTPAEEQTLICVDSSTGQSVWRRPREKSRYLAGVRGKLAIVVAHDQIEALQIDTGETVWSSELNGQLPAGIGAMTENTYLLPLQSGELLTVDLETGAFSAPLHFSDRRQLPGNMVSAAGMLFSQSVYSVSAYLPKQQRLADLQRRMNDAPDDFSLVLDRVAFHRLERSSAEVVRELQGLQLPDNLAVDQRQRYRRMLIDALVAAIREQRTSPSSAGDAASNENSAVDSPDDYFMLLKPLAEQPRERLLFESLWIDHLQASGQGEQAWSQLLQLADEAGDWSELQLARPDGRSGKVRTDCWISGLLGKIWKESSAETRERLTASLDKFIDAKAEVKGADLARLLRLVDFHPSAIRIADRWMTQLPAVDGLSIGELLLLRYASRLDDSQRAQWEQRLYALQQKQQLSDEWPLFLKSIAGKTGDSAQRAEPLRPAADKTSKNEAGNNDKNENADAKADKEPAADPTVRTALARDLLSWGEFSLNVRRSGMGHNDRSEQPLLLDEFTLPSLCRWAYSRDAGNRRFLLKRPGNYSAEWSFPLPVTSATNRHRTASLQAIGHQLILENEGDLFAVSPGQQRIRWKCSLEEADLVHRPFPIASRSNSDRVPVMQPPEVAVSRFGLYSRYYQDAGVVEANARYVAYHGHGRLVVVDPLDGTVLWTREKLLPEARVIGSSRWLAILGAPGKPIEVFEARNGRQLDFPGLDQVLPQAIGLTDQGFVLFEKTNQTSFLLLKLLLSPQYQIRLYDPETQKTVWSESFPQKSVVAPLDRDRWGILLSDHSFSVLDCRDGSRMQLGIAPVQDAQQHVQSYCVPAGETVLLLRHSNSNTHYGSNLPSVQINGQLTAFDLVAGKQAWTRVMDSQRLLLPHLQESPVLIFAARNYVKEEPTNYWAPHVIVLDKRNGEQLAEVTMPSVSSFDRLTMNIPDRWFELRSSNVRLRFEATDQPSGDQ